MKLTWHAALRLSESRIYHGMLEHSTYFNAMVRAPLMGGNPGICSAQPRRTVGGSRWHVRNRGRREVCMSVEAGGDEVTIKKWVELGKEVEISISVDDITAALAECFDSVEYSAHSVADVLRGLNYVASFMNAIKDQNISDMNAQQRKVVSDFLEKELVRWSVK